MVLASPVGKPRAFWRGLLLTVVTFGVYGVYWNYKAHVELHRQFELQREGRDDGMAWYVLGLVLPPLVFPYYWSMASNVAYLRERLGIERGIGPTAYVTLQAVATAGYLGALLAGVVGLAIFPMEGEGGAHPDAFLTIFLPLVLLGLGAFVVVAPLAYARLQGDVNAVWAAYGRRMRELSTPPPPPPVGPLPSPEAWPAAPPGPPGFARAAPPSVAPPPPPPPAARPPPRAPPPGTAFAG